MQIETRFSHVRTAAPRIAKRADGGPLIVGYAAVFYNPRDPGTMYQLDRDVFERIRPGAFDKALRERDDVRALFNHSADHILGRTAAGTLRLSVDATGLRYEIDPPDTQTARDLMASLRRGDITGSSFAFNIEGEEYTRVGSVCYRELRCVRLFDAGPVTYPAYASASSGCRAGADWPKGGRRCDADWVAVELAILDGDHFN